MIFKIAQLQIQKSSNKRDMTKKPDLTQNRQNFITLTKQIIFFWNFENRSVFFSSIISPSFTPRSFHSRSRSRFKDLTFTTLDMWIFSHLFFFSSFFSFLISLLHLTNSYDIIRDFQALDVFQLSHQTT